MLYDRWRRTVQSRPDELALLDTIAGRRWTFGELFLASESGSQSPGSVVFPQGSGSGFVLGVLSAWRNGRAVCPLEHGQNPPDIPGALPAGITHLKMTSATTGKPRLVAFTAEQLMADADNIVQTMGLRAEWPNLGVISLAHSYGFSNLVLPLVLKGIPLLLVGSALPEAVRGAAGTLSEVTLPAVPALWQAWHDANAIPANVRLAISAGAPLPLALESAVYSARGLKIHNFYGSSECGGIAYDQEELPRADAACAGSPMANVTVSIAENGCVKVQSKAVGQTYWPEPAPELQPGIFQTSDMGRVTGGKLYLSGRAGDQINVAGRKVRPESIEAVLGKHPQVRACLAFGVPSSDPQRGEVIVACVAAHSQGVSESLRQFAMSSLPAWQVPREWWFVENLEPNGRGKLSRAEWRRRYLESGRGSSPLRVNSPRTTN